MSEAEDEEKVKYNKAHVLKRMRERRLARNAYRPEKGAQKILNGLILVATLILGAILIFMLVVVLA